MGEIDPRIGKAIEFHERRALRFLLLRLVVVGGAAAVIMLAPWWVGAPVGIVAFLFGSPELIERTLLRSFRRKQAAIKGDPAKVVWVHYDAHGEKICPVFLYDRHADFAALHLPSGYPRQLLDAFRARSSPPIITTTDEERRILEPRQKFLGKLLELEALATSAPQKSLRELAPTAVGVFGRLHKHFGATLDAEGRASVEEKIDRLWLCYTAANDTPRGNHDFNDEIAELVGELSAASTTYR